MQIRIALSVLGLAASLAAASAGATLRMVEQAVETSTLTTSLPDDASGSIAVSACAGCKPVLLQLSSKSQYFIGKTPVTYAQFRAAAANGSSRQLNVFYEAKDRTITRLVVSGGQSTPVRQPHKD
jgi:formylglycine-generating enzyme required for sulfatase activity